MVISCVLCVRGHSLYMDMCLPGLNLVSSPIGLGMMKQF